MPHAMAGSPACSRSQPPHTSVLRFGTRLEARLNGDFLIAVRPCDVPETAKDYDADLLAIEQFAYDLDVVQRHTDHFFNVPESMLLGDRVKMRVARLLIEGHIVASPRAAIHRRNDRQRHPRGARFVVATSIDRVARGTVRRDCRRARADDR
jgi:hypothetical protein